MTCHALTFESCVCPRIVSARIESAMHMMQRGLLVAVCPQQVLTESCLVCQVLPCEACYAR